MLMRPVEVPAEIYDLQMIDDSSMAAHSFIIEMHTKALDLALQVEKLKLDFFYKNGYYVDDV